MIVVDSSSIVAIFRQEPDAERYALRIAADEQPLLSAANLLEVSIVLQALKRLSAEQAEEWLNRFLREGGIEVEPVTRLQTDLARQAHARFGKGTGHPAALNYGDCFAYALARDRGAPLLYKGDDFIRTDIIAAL